ncbi:glutamine synthetase family protein [Larsenimonas salina]|uniref:glutamine synthetase family protein n=1 Tax=Larsenimonas salina TaxID=1295565 RepID=UPI0020745D9F|nr:glutamine synthetase family protein [Larsenimonas salina]MCM5705593.1 glutamine synthetase family protein [Larsenimonas salina]
MPFSLVQTARAFLDGHPDVETVDVLISDLNGVMRGKRLPRDGLLKACTQGIQLPASLFALDICGNTIEETGLGLDSGDGDRTCWPLADTFAPTPWRPGRAQVLMSMFEPDGTAFFADPRHVLAQTLSRFTERGLTPVVALELEFYLVERRRDARGRIHPPCAPSTGERAVQSQLYAMNELDEYAGVLEDIQAAARAQGLPLDSALKECAPGQFEINLIHSSNALAAADSAVLLKRLIRGVAEQHDLEATFMAKPFGDEAGSGAHVHISLEDAHGTNLFAADNGALTGSDTLGHAIGGLLELMPASMAVFAPNLNSFRRFQPGLYVPMAPSWGVDNRSVAIRIPSGPDHARRLEHRVAGADANPYLLLATLLASILYGLDHRTAPGAPIAGNAYTQLAPSLTNSWREALSLFEHSDALKASLGDAFHFVYCANRRAEREQAMARVSTLEYDWYLRHV